MLYLRVPVSVCMMNICCLVVSVAVTAVATAAAAVAAEQWRLMPIAGYVAATITV